MNPLRSEQFNDVYFSAQGGLAETRHVFLRGNNLPDAWQNRSDFVIAEAGFGTGLNFLGAAALFLETAPTRARLHYIAFEKHPLRAGDIHAALAPWWGELGGTAQEFLQSYPLRVPGFHRLFLARDRIFLTLVFGDINDTLPELDASIDCWFLDGFAPDKNPAMWSDALFENMARLSASGATASTYSAARVVKDGLVRAGFEIKKEKGFGAKRDMTTARFSQPGRTRTESVRGKQVAILGGGLAATSAAFMLSRYGHYPVLVAPNGLADGASGNPRGLYNPRFSGAPATAFYTAGYALLVRELARWKNHEGLAWTQTGSLHLPQSDDDRKRFARLIESGWHHDHAQQVDAKTATDIAGLNIARDPLFLPNSGSLAPAALCALYAQDIPIEKEIPETIDAVVIASGMETKEYPGLSYLPLSVVRGQISVVRPNLQTEPLKTNLCYGGYLSPARAGTHVLGATFVHHTTETDVCMDEHIFNLDRLRDRTGLSIEITNVTDGRAALRVKTPDRAPIAGWSHNDKRGRPVYVSTAHASHGLVTTPMAAITIADHLSALPSPFSGETTQSVTPRRFLKKS